MSPTTITTPPMLRLVAAGNAERPTVTFRVMLDAQKGVYVNAGITAEHPAIAVTPTLLARLGLGRLRREAVRAALAEHNPELLSRPALKTFFKGTTGRPVAEKVRSAPTAEHLETVATIRRLARLSGDYPNQAVARSFGLDVADAKRWVSLARHLG